MRQITRHQIPTRFNKPGFTVAGLFLVALCVLGMAKAPKTVDDARGVVEKSLSQVETAYEARNLQEMLDCFDSGYPALLSLQDYLQKQFAAYKTLGINFIIDSYLIAPDKTEVKLHWLKKTTDSSGTILKTKGSAEFIFSTKSGRYLLSQINGDNPL